MTLQAVKFHDGEREVCGLMKVGTKLVHIIVIDDAGVRVLSEPAEAIRYTRPLLHRNQPYPIDRFCKHLRRVGRERGITQKAKELMGEA